MVTTVPDFPTFKKGQKRLSAKKLNALVDAVKSLLDTVNKKDGPLATLGANELWIKNNQY